MTEKEPAETVELADEGSTKKSKAKTKVKEKAKVRAKVKAKAKAKPPRTKAEKPDKPVPDFDFIGKVESLRVASGVGAEGFQFGLRGRHGRRKIFRFDTADAFAMNAMAHLVLAAHASDTKVGVRTGGEVEGVLVVRELESRPKIGKGA